MKKVNLGCGERYSKGWINLDFNAHCSEVISHNLLTTLPFADQEVDVIYHSHFLEHLSKQEAKNFLIECHRILKPQGVMRIVVPDLAHICREYLEILEHIDLEENKKKYEWIIIELLDQLVRTETGGLMAQFWAKVTNQKDHLMINYIQQRSGENLQKELIDKPSFLTQVKQLNFTKIKRKLFYLYLGLIKNLLPPAYRNSIIDNTILGEKHKWMYDQYSLSLLLEEVGFLNIKFLDAKTSSIPNFTQDYLDINLDETPYKQSSIYCEAYLLIP